MNKSDKYSIGLLGASILFIVLALIFNSPLIIFGLVFLLLSSIIALTTKTETSTKIIVLIPLLLFVIWFIAVLFTPAPNATSDSRAWAEGCSIEKQKGCIESDFGTNGYKISDYMPFGTEENGTLLVACQMV